MMTVAFYKGRERWASRFLAWWARSDYSHCEVILSRDGDRFECASSSLMDGGVRVKWIELRPEHWTLVDMPVNLDAVDAAIPRRGLTDREAAAAFVRAWFDAHAGEGYDLLGLLGFVVRRIKGWRRMWWCSEACAAALGFPDPWRFDVAAFLAVARTIGREHRGAFALAPDAAT